MRYFIVAVLGVIGFGALYGQPTGRLNPNDVRVQVAGDEFTVAEMERRYGTDYELTRRSAEGVPNATVDDQVLAYHYSENAVFWFFERSEDQYRFLSAWRIDACFAIAHGFEWVFEISRDDLTRVRQRYTEINNGAMYALLNGSITFSFGENGKVNQVTWSNSGV